MTESISYIIILIQTQLLLLHCHGERQKGAWPSHKKMKLLRSQRHFTYCVFISTGRCRGNGQVVALFAFLYIRILLSSLISLSAYSFLFSAGLFLPEIISSHFFEILIYL